MIYLLGSIFVISRLLFLNWSNVFFDSKEYALRWASPDFLQALTNGHPPLHSGYVLVFWPLYQLASLVGLNGAMMVTLAQALMAFLTVFFFYKSVVRLFDKEVAAKAAILLSVLPIYWIVNEAVMMETTYLFFWVLSLFFLTKSLSAKKNWILYLIFSGLFWILSFLTHTVVIMWIPLLIYIVWWKGRKNLIPFLVFGVITLVSASIINAALLAKAYNTNLTGGLYWLYSAKFGEHAFFSLSFETVLRYLRNFLVPLGYNNTWVLLFLSFLGLISSIKYKGWLFWLAVLWIAPSFITNQWWDSLLFGRHSLIASFALVILAAQILDTRGVKVLFGLLLIISLSDLVLLKKQIPYQAVATQLNKLPPGGLVIDSHFARPQTDGEYFGQMIFVDEPGWNINDLPQVINGYLNYNKPVYVTGQALSEPYGLFCGPYLHNLSLSYKNKYILSDLIVEYKISKVVDIDSNYNLDIYEIKPGVGDYPLINKLTNSRRRIDWLDPFRVLTFYLLSAIHRQ